MLDGILFILGTGIPKSGICLSAILPTQACHRWLRLRVRQSSCFPRYLCDFPTPSVDFVVNWCRYMKFRAEPFIETLALFHSFSLTSLDVAPPVHDLNPPTLSIC